MKHYLSHDASGRLVGVHTFAHAQMKIGGWPENRKLEDGKGAAVASKTTADALAAAHTALKKVHPKDAHGRLLAETTVAEAQRAKDAADHVANMRQTQLGGINGAVEFVVYQCPCDPSKQRCDCAGKRLGTGRVVDGAVVDKKTGTIICDGSPVANGGTLKRPPGTKLSLTLTSTGAVDGSIAHVYQGGHVVVLDVEGSGPVELTFKGNTTPPFEAVAPAQGLTGAIRVGGDDLQPIVMFLRGWAS
jgi:hypothetical protein